jgi:hypothetical protein
MDTSAILVVFMLYIHTVKRLEGQDETLMANLSRQKVKILVNLATSYDGIRIHHEWICNKCFKIYSSYESMRLHKQEAHAY